MSVKPISVRIESNNSAKKHSLNNEIKRKDVSFGGTNFIVDSMDFIEKGGFVASFCIQDFIGFIAPRVGKGLVRGSKKKDENGNPLLDENGKQVREYNWALARKELLRELITGPSAFVIPWAALKGINKVASGNNVKLNYIDGFNDAFADYAKTNMAAIKAGNAPKTGFYKNVLENVISESINGVLPAAERMSKEEIAAEAQKYAQRLVDVESISADKSLTKKQRSAKIAELGDSVEDLFMKLKKSKVGGAVNELGVSFKSTNGKIQGGSIGELIGSMSDYFSDAVHSTKKALTNNADANLADIVKSFTHRRMGTRVLTNLGLFGAVAAFYTQIPKLYNKGLKEDPALKGTVVDPSMVTGETKEDKPEKNAKKSLAFTGLGSGLEKLGKGVFNTKALKGVSDVFELNGPVISGMAMPVLLYGFCIPPRLEHAQSKYDYGEIILRDMTSFTALLFGAKALSRLFSDGLTKSTGLGLHSKNLQGLNPFQKVWAYFSPSGSHHSILSSKQLDSKYTNLQDYKGGVDGFVEFIEKSGGNIKKALSRDSKVRESVEAILKDFNGKTYAQATVDEIKSALSAANKAAAGTHRAELMESFYNIFKKPTKLLKVAKTCNSGFNFLSSFVLVPGLIISLTNACERMTAKRTAKDFEEANAKKKIVMEKFIASRTPTMAGFLGNK
ncbi:MAG: hypothetical protein NC191_00140 [Muribaculaceae bacterium]|nr:hypothetical protein [Muribaculaceae bacterium]